MKLTARQEQMVSAFLREVAAEAESLPPEDRAKTLARVKSRLRDELGKRGDRLEDSDVAAALRRTRPTAKTATQHTEPVAPAPARASVPERPAEPQESQSSFDTREDSSRWLGVCSSIASALNVEPVWIRLGFVGLGIVLPPIAVMLYIAVFLEQYFHSKRGELPRIAWWRMAQNVFIVGVITIILYQAGFRAFDLADYLYTRFLEKALILGKWAWLEDWHGTLLFWVLFTSLPLAVLGSLPMRRGWDYTWLKVSQAIVALYSVAVCAGIGSLLTGLILLLVEEFAG